VPLQAATVGVPTHTTVGAQAWRALEWFGWNTHSFSLVDFGGLRAPFPPDQGKEWRCGSEPIWLVDEVHSQVLGSGWEEAGELSSKWPEASGRGH